MVTDTDIHRDRHRNGQIPTRMHTGVDMDTDADSDTNKNAEANALLGIWMMVQQRARIQTMIKT